MAGKKIKQSTIFIFFTISIFLFFHLSGRSSKISSEKITNDKISSHEKMTFAGRRTSNKSKFHQGAGRKSQFKVESGFTTFHGIVTDSNDFTFRSVFRLLSDESDDSNNDIDRINNDASRIIKFITHEPFTKASAALLLGEIKKFQDVIVVKNSSDIIQSLLETSISFGFDFTLISTPSAWIEWKNLKSVLKELSKEGCFGDFTSTGEIQSQYGNSGFLISKSVAEKFLQDDDLVIDNQASFEESQARLSTYLSRNKINCKSADHLRIYGEPFANLVTSHPYIADGYIVYTGMKDRLDWIVRAASHTRYFTGLDDNLEKLYRSLLWDPNQETKFST